MIAVLKKESCMFIVENQSHVYTEMKVIEKPTTQRVDCVPTQGYLVSSEGPVAGEQGRLQHFQQPLWLDQCLIPGPAQLTPQTQTQAWV